ncbi:MAG: tyrosinase family protein [Pseudobacteriovorax sp.]|nr:tyrosinase family protein [Pseudobacteriovorax sp.]
MEQHAMPRKLISRRSLIGKTAAASAFVIAGCKTIGQRNSASAVKVAPVNPGVPKRMPWSELSPDDRKAFIDAVLDMNKQRITPQGSFTADEVGDGLVSRWRAQAQTHELFCDHGTWRFLPWHRAYLYYFEKYLRKVIRDDFRLPYWRWDVDTNLPKEFLDESISNELQLTPRRGTTIALPGEGRLSETWWQGVPGDISSSPDFDSIGGDRFSNGLIESPSHNQVHVRVGGLMGRVPAAARDPLFWLHHCNIDRLWSVWMDAAIVRGFSRTLFPSEDIEPWLTESYTNHFIDSDDKVVSGSTRESLFTETMEYNYDTMTSTWEVSDIPPNLPTLEDEVDVEEIVDEPLEEDLSLGLINSNQTIKPRGLSIGFKIPQNIVSSSSPLLSLRLKILGLKKPKLSGTSYRLSLQLGNRRLDLPSIAFFPGDHDHHKKAVPFAVALNKYMSVIKAGSTESLKLIVHPENERGEYVSFAEAVDGFTTNKNAYRVTMKAVYRT